jgi:AraC-like DNA-binding protein
VPDRAHPIDADLIDERRVQHDFGIEKLGDGTTGLGGLVAGVACLSPVHFAPMFSAATGVAPHRYVSQQRLETAMVLLAAGKRSLSDIALSGQFSSQASFNRAFRRATGVTPGKYRRARR